MEGTAELVDIVKQWINIDNDLRDIQKQQSAKKNEKKQITQKLIEVMKNNNIDCLDTRDGQIHYNKKNVKKTISKKFLVNLLPEYYNGNMERAMELNNFIMDNREETTKETITRK